MSEERITPIVMPKWGLSMREGKIAAWLVEDGTKVKPGEEILEVETDKIAGAVEAPSVGVLRRVGKSDGTYPVKALIGVVADESVPATEIEAFVSGYVLPAGEEGEDDAGPKYEYAETPFGRLRYAKRGEGDEAVILMHGFGGDADNWLFNIDALAESATVYALDLPGHGQSEKSLADPGLSSLAQAVEAFMAAVGVGSAHLVGHSMGGAIGMEIAASRPDKVKSLTLICSAGLGPEIGDYISGYVAAQSRRELKPVLQKLFADKDLVNRSLIDDVLKYKRLDGVDAVLARLRDALFGDGKQRISPAAKLNVPLPRTLVIWGEQDEVIPAAHAGNLAGAEVKVIAGAGHMVFMEKAGEVNALIKAHLSRP